MVTDHLGDQIGRNVGHVTKRDQRPGYHPRQGGDSGRHRPRLTGSKIGIVRKGDFQPMKRRDNLVTLVARHHNKILDAAVKHRPRRPSYQRLTVDFDNKLVDLAHPPRRPGRQQNPSNGDVAWSAAFNHLARQRA